MAKARPKACVRERAIAAFKKAHPSCPHRITAHKRRGAQHIVVYGYEYADPSIISGTSAVWSYADNGSLRRVN